MLELAARGRLTRREVELPLGGPARLLYVSDLHLTPWHAHVVDQVLEQARQCQPDLVVLGGDLADLPSGLAQLERLISCLPAPVLAVPGNHDRQLGLVRVRAAVERAGGIWLEQPYALKGLILDGVCRSQAEPGSILCAHEPIAFEAAARAGYALVLAGHLHGSQFVLGERGGLLYPGAWFYRWNGDQFQRGKCTMLVSRGVNDTLPIRWNCPREVLLCRFLPRS